MRAFTLDSFETPPRLRDDVPVPTAGANEVLVRVHASSVNPADAAIAAGMLKGMAEYEFPVTLGRDFAGVAQDVGQGVDRYESGDEVFGFVLHANPTVHDGSWADYVGVADATIARKPARVDFATAAAAPLAALTALAAVDALELSEGSAVVVLGASGGVGSFFVQLAAAAGARVIAPGLSEDREYLRALGASGVPDRNADVTAHVRKEYPEGVDALLDLVSFAPRLAPQAGGTARLTARCGRRRARPEQRDGVSHHGESRSARSAARCRRAPCPHTGHVCARGGGESTGDARANAHPGKARDHDRLTASASEIITRERAGGGRESWPRRPCWTA